MLCLGVFHPCGGRKHDGLTSQVGTLRGESNYKGSSPVGDYDRSAGLVSGDVGIEQGWQPGVYYLYTWGRYTDTRAKVLLSMLTVKAR